MGMFDAAFAVAHPTEGEFADTTAIVDTGAIYTFLPTSFLKSLNIPVKGQKTFTLADGSVKQYDIGEARLRLSGQVFTNIVVFGDEGISLLGAVTLETFGLIADTTARQLIPAPKLYLVGMQ